MGSQRVGHRVTELNFHNIQYNTSKMYNSKVFSIFTELFNSHHNLRGLTSSPKCGLFFFNIYFFIWLHQVLVAVCGIEPSPPALGEWSLSHWTTG